MNRIFVMIIVPFCCALVLLEIALYVLPLTFYPLEMTRYSLLIKKPSNDPELSHIHRPNTSAKLMNVNVRINSLGLRDQEYQRKKHEGTRRIIFLGDSLTFGWGVPAQHTFEHLLEKRISQHKAIEVLNFGIGNYNTSQQVQLFHEKGLELDPDQVVLFYFINDAEPTPIRNPLWFLGYSRAITLIKERTTAIATNFGKHPSFLDYYKSLYRDDSPAWQKTQASFSKLKEICEMKGITLQVVILPELHNLQDYPFINEHKKLTNLLSSKKIMHLDLAPYFQKVKNPVSLWVAKDDAHPNEKAHEMIADYSYRFIENNIVKD